MSAMRGDANIRKDSGTEIISDASSTREALPKQFIGKGQNIGSMFSHKGCKEQQKITTWNVHTMLGEQRQKFLGWECNGVGELFLA